MSTVTPNFTDTGQSAVALATLTQGSVTSGTVDLRAKRGAWFFARVGRGGTTALTTGIGVIVRRSLNNNGIEQPIGPAYVGDITAAIETTCAASGNTAGQNVLQVASTTSFGAGDFIFIDGTGGTTNSEWARVSKVTDSTHFQLDRNLQFAHVNTSDHVRNHADVWPPLWVDGGAVAEVVFDYGASTTGNTATVECRYQTYDSDTVA